MKASSKLACSVQMRFTSTTYSSHGQSFLPLRQCTGGFQQCLRSLSGSSCQGARLAYRRCFWCRLLSGDMLPHCFSGRLHWLFAALLFLSFYSRHKRASHRPCLVFSRLNLLSWITVPSFACLRVSQTILIQSAYKTSFSALCKTA